MFLNGIEALHIEPTARCNAMCPMCARTNNSKILDNQGEITIDQFKSFFPPHIIASIKQIKFCGNYGDPAVATDLLEMHKYIWSINSDAKIIISTNGGIRGEDFWTQLGLLYSEHKSSVVHFHIDGLEDTNHIYRIGVRWDKVVSNATAFIKGGGNAQWFFIPFFHNEHQIEKAETLSKELGFSKFVIKISGRFNDFKKPFKGNGSTLYPPTDSRFNIQSMQVEGELICFAEERKEAYIDAWGRFFPCCWTGSTFFNTNNWPMHHDIKINSLHHRKIEDIISDPVIDTWISSLYNNKKSVCNKRCTGSMQHVIDVEGTQRPQKILWYYGEKNNGSNVNLK